MIKIAILASGSGTNAENMIRYFSDKEDIGIALVLSNNPQAGVLSRAERLGVPSYVFSNEDFERSEKIDLKLREYEIDFIVLAGFLKKISSSLVNSYPKRIINIHPALLPKFGGKGMYGHRVHEAVIAAGEKETGITIHYVSEGYDEGQIIFQAKFPVSEADTVEDVERKIHQLEYRHFPEVIEKLLKF
jgi:phosphoribosylglycinamide formyltransferase-1